MSKSPELVVLRFDKRKAVEKGHVSTNLLSLAFFVIEIVNLAFTFSEVVLETEVRP